MKGRLISIFFLFFIIISFSQVSFSQLTYTVSQSRGCPPFTVTVTGSRPAICTAGTYLYNVYYNNAVIFTGVVNESDFVFDVLSVGGYRIEYQANCPGGTTSPTSITVQGLDFSTPSILGQPCANRVASVNILENKFDRYLINWNDASSLQTVTGNNRYQRTYSDLTNRNINIAGVYSYTVNGVLSSCGSNVNTSITPQSNLQKAIFTELKVENLSTNQGIVSMKLELDDRFQYQSLYREQSSAYFAFDTLSNTAGAYTYTFGGLNTAARKYAFMFKTFDVCGAQLRGDSIWTLPIKAKALTSGDSVYIGELLEKTASYSLSVNGQNLFSGRIEPPPTVIPYFDENVVCNQQYCYETEAVISTLPRKISSISAQVCVTGLKPSTFTGVRNLNSTYEANKVKLSWEANTVSGVSYRVLAVDAKGDTSISDVITENIMFPKKQGVPCYDVQVLDNCGKSFFQRTCPIRLEGKMDNIEQNSLNYTTYVNPDLSSVINYNVELYTESGELITTFSSVPANTYLHNPIDQNNQVVVYRVVATLSNGSVTSSNFIPITQELRLYVPTAFSPNGDGINDVFFCKGLFWDSIEMFIYNRWGQTVFYTDNKNEGWGGGNFNPDLYHVYVTVKDKFGKKITSRQTLHLSR